MNPVSSAQVGSDQSPGPAHVVTMVPSGLKSTGLSPNTAKNSRRVPPTETNRGSRRSVFRDSVSSKRQVVPSSSLDITCIRVLLLAK